MPTHNSRSIVLRERERVLEGILVPRRWRASGEISAVALNTLDEREYLIEDPGCEARGLLDHLRKRVRITGTVLGNRVVRVTTVTVQDFPIVPERPGAEKEPK